MQVQEYKNALESLPEEDINHAREIKKSNI